MQYGFVFPGSGARTAADLAHEAEAAGWDGFFVWDSVWGMDPWVTLAAVAVSTERIRIGTMLTPVSRRRPWKLAGETVTLDHLSNGRLILSVGLGAPETGFAQFGEETDRKIRAELLDEGLDILTGLWRGQPFNYDGKHYRVRETTFMPPLPPVQSPRSLSGSPGYGQASGPCCESSATMAYFRSRGVRTVLSPGWSPPTSGKQRRTSRSGARKARRHPSI